MQANNNNLSLSDEIKKSVSINEILDRFGISHPDKSDYLIRCPWREDHNPSLHIFIGKDKTCKWYDNGTGEHGSVIDVYMRLSGQRDFKEAVKEIKNGFSFSSKPTFSTYQEPMIKTSKIKVQEILPNVSMEYLQNHLKINRRFPIALYNDYFSEIVFYFDKEDKNGNERRFLHGFGIPINNGGQEIGGWNIRTCMKNAQNNKLFIGSGFTLIRNGFARLVIFEGMCDMLAFVALFPKEQADFLVLNGIGNKEKALEYLNNLEWPYISVGLALDNDKNGSGQKTTQEMLKGLPDYPYKVAKMAHQWLEQHPEASEKERKCYEGCLKCGNVDLVPWIWGQFPEVKTCKDVCEVWQRVADRDRWRNLQFKSCEVCKTPCEYENEGERKCYGNIRKGLRHIIAQYCPYFKRI